MPHGHAADATGLSPAQQALLRRVLGEEAVAPPATTIAVVRDGSRTAPLSFAQRRLWAIEKMWPGNPAFNIPLALTVRGPLDLRALERSLIALSRRHETLRTTFEDRDDEAVQVIGDPPLRLAHVVDLTSLAAPRRTRELQALARDEAVRPFDLTRGPLLRATIVRLSSETHGVLLTLHHIVSDHWSMTVLIREVATLYTAFTAEAPVSLAPLPIQYRDYARWQRGSLDGDGLAAHRDYWRRQLTGVAPALPLPTDRPRPRVQSLRGAGVGFRWPATFGARLQAASLEGGVTLFMLGLAGLTLLLSRYCGQRDVVVGTLSAGRDREEIEGLIGFFINVLVLRTDVTGDPTVRELLARVRTVALGAYAHQAMPFEQLVEEFGGEHDPSRHPLVQVALALEAAMPSGAGDSRLPGLTLETVPLESRTTRFDLSLTIMESGANIGGVLNYSVDLFDNATASRMLGHLHQVLDGMMTRPEARLSELSLLDAVEREQVMARTASPMWPPAGSPMVWARVPCVHDAIAAWAAARPDAIALVSGDAHVTFGDLLRSARAQARDLARRGVGPDVTVAVCAERSEELIIALLAILLAGGAYVPLDPGTPGARLRFMVDDAGAVLLLSTPRMVPKLPLLAIPTVVVDPASLRAASDERAGETTGGGETGSAASAGEWRPTDPEQLAYVIYTSGSTGQPKGVMIPHGGLTNYLAWCVEAYDVAGGRGAALHSTVAADLAVTSLWAPLVAGQRLVLVPESASIEGLGALLADETDLSLLKITPAHLDLLRQTLPPAAAAGRVRTLVIGGEALQEEALAFWRTHAPSTRLINEYGPTETVVGCCVHESVSAEAGQVSIGRPIANTTAYVLDVDGQLAPAGVPGELFIGGAGVGRGYRGRPDLTASRFVPDPWSGRPGARLYRTGDRARWRAGGALDFLGRLDDQVKLRGYRIEPAEIEAALASHPAVESAVVILREDRPSEKRLVAYVTGADARTAGSDALRSHAATLLPSYMLPEQIVMLDRLPMTANAKVDRASLPSPDDARDATAAPDTRPLAPRDVIELELLRVWEECLGRDDLGIRDDFFERGGHSMQLLSLMGAVQRRFGRAVSLPRFVEAPTVERLAMLVRRSKHAPDASSCLVALQAGGDRPPFFCAPPGGGNAVHYRHLARGLAPEQPFFGLQAPGSQGEAEPFLDYEGLAQHYVQAIRERQPHGPYFLGGWSSGGRVALEMAQQMRRAGESVALLAIFDEQIEPAELPRDAAGEPDDAQILYSMIGFRLPLDLAQLRAWSEEERLAHVLGLAQAASLLPPDYGVAEARHLFRVFRASTIANARYEAQPYDGVVTLFWASDTLRGEDPESYSARWRALASGGVDTHVIPGNHLTLLDGDNARALAGRLGACLDATGRVVR